jgi:hypothetical protein
VSQCMNSPAEDIVQFAIGLSGVVAVTASEATGAPEVSWGDSFFFYDPAGYPPTPGQGGTRRAVHARGGRWRRAARRWASVRRERAWTAVALGFRIDTHAWAA